MTENANPMPPQSTMANTPQARYDESTTLIRTYGSVYPRILVVAVPVTWVIAMLTSMSFLRCNTIEAMGTGLTASIVVATVVLVLVTATAGTHRMVLIAMGPPSPPTGEQQPSLTTTTTHALLLVLWAAMMYLQHHFGANLLFWGLFDIDEPWPLFNPNIDPLWAPAFLCLITATVLAMVARYRWPSLTRLWLVTTIATATGWFALILVNTVSNDLINYRISIAALEGTITWWSERGEASALLILTAGLVGIVRIRSAWIDAQYPD